MGFYLPIASQLQVHQLSFTIVRLVVSLAATAQTAGDQRPELIYEQNQHRKYIPAIDLSGGEGVRMKKEALFFVLNYSKFVWT